MSFNFPDELIDELASQYGKETNCYGFGESNVKSMTKNVKKAEKNETKEVKEMKKEQKEKEQTKKTKNGDEKNGLCGRK